MISLFKRPKFYIPAGIIVLIIILIVSFGGGGDSSATTGVVKQRDIAQKVSVTGRVRSMSDVSLAFDRSGRVASVSRDIGDRVSPGQLLVVLENADIQANLAQAQANVRAEEAKLAELKQGSTAEEVNVKKANVTKAESALKNSRRSALNALQDSYTAFDDSIRNTADKFFSNPRSANPLFSVTTDSTTRSDAEGKRVGIETILTTWNVVGLTEADMTPESPAFTTTKTNLIAARALLDRIAFAVNSLTSNSSISQTTIDAYKAAVSAARNQVNTAISSLTTAEESVKTAESSLSIAKSELALASAPTRPENITAQEAKVDGARANRDSYNAQLSKTYIYSPISGVVTSRNVEPGEVVSANTTAMTVISDQDFKIEANITESDIAGIKAGDSAVLTLDAYPDVNLSAKVVAIDPAETVIDGVPTYKTTLHFNDKDSRIKSGMTANIDILTAEVKDALVVPSRSVYERDGKKYIKIVDGKDTKEVEVTTGIRDGEGGIQVLTGVKVGDAVALPSSK